MCSIVHFVWRYYHFSLHILPCFVSSSHHEDTPTPLFNPRAKGLTHKLSSLQPLDLELLKNSSPPPLSSSSSSSSSSSLSSLPSSNFPLAHIDADPGGDGNKDVNGDVRLGTGKRKMGDKDELDIPKRKLVKRQRFDDEGMVRVQGSCEGYVCLVGLQLI